MQDQDFPPDYPDDGLAPDDGPTPDDRLLADCAAEQETDIGNGLRLRRRFGDLARHYAGAASFIAISVAHIGWFVYDGRRWKEDEDESLIRQLAHRTAEAIRKEPAIIDVTDEQAAIVKAGEVAALALDQMSATKRLPDPETTQRKRDYEAVVEEAEKILAMVDDRRSSRRRHAKSTAGSSKLSNMLNEARPYMARSVKDLNPDPMMLNCLSGTIDFVEDDVLDEYSDAAEPAYLKVWRARIRPHDQADMITKLVEANWSDGARPPMPEFRLFLTKVQPDPLIRGFLKRFCGYLLTGLTVEQVMLFFYGAGRNGKSTFVELLCHILGDYSVTLSIDSFSGDNKRGGGEATPDLARLPGARMVAASEPEANTKLKDALIKTLTGGEKIPVRRLHKDFFEVDPHFKIVLSGNHKPRIDDDSDGIWRRLLLVPWLIQIDKADIDRMLPKKLRAEADGVFAWMVEGAVEYLNEGLAIPEAVRMASEEYRQESDAIGTFIRLACNVTGVPETREKPFDLYVAFEKFADAEGVFKVSRSTFEKRLSKAAERSFEGPDRQMRQFRKHRSNGETHYLGIELRPEWLPSQGDRSGSNWEEER